MAQPFQGTGESAKQPCSKIADGFPVTGSCWRLEKLEGNMQTGGQGVCLGPSSEPAHIAQGAERSCETKGGEHAELAWLGFISVARMEARWWLAGAALGVTESRDHGITGWFGTGGIIQFQLPPRPAKTKPRHVESFSWMRLVG